MRIGRALTVPAIVTLGMARSILATTAAPVAAAQTAVNIQASGTQAIPYVFYHA
jgi:hypothetical protein